MIIPTYRLNFLKKILQHINISYFVTILHGGCASPHQLRTSSDENI